MAQAWPERPVAAGDMSARHRGYSPGGGRRRATVTLPIRAPSRSERTPIPNGLRAVSVTARNSILTVTGTSGPGEACRDAAIGGRTRAGGDGCRPVGGGVREQRGQGGQQRQVGR